MFQTIMLKQNQEKKYEDSMSWDKFAKLNINENHQVMLEVHFVISHLMLNIN